MASSLYPPLRIRDIPGPQPGQFGVVRKQLRASECCMSVTCVCLSSKSHIDRPRTSSPRTENSKPFVRDARNSIEKRKPNWTRSTSINSRRPKPSMLKFNEKWLDGWITQIINSKIDANGRERILLLPLLQTSAVFVFQSPRAVGCWRGAISSRSHRFERNPSGTYWQDASESETYSRRERKWTCQTGSREVRSTFSTRLRRTARIAIERIRLRTRQWAFMADAREGRQKERSQGKNSTHERLV